MAGFAAGAGAGTGVPFEPVEGAVDDTLGMDIGVPATTGAGSSRGIRTSANAPPTSTAIRIHSARTGGGYAGDRQFSPWA